MKTPYEIGVKYALEKNAWAVGPALLGLGKALRFIMGGNKAVFAKAAPAIAQAAPTYQQAIQAGGGSFGKAVLSPAWQSLRSGVSNHLSQIGNAYRDPSKGVLGALNVARKTPMGRDVVWGSLLGGGFNAAMAEPGERLKAFGTGATTGGAGGAIFRGTHAAASAFRNTRPIQARIGAGGLKGFGTRMGTQPTLLGAATSMMLPAGAHDVKKPGLPMSNIPGYY